MSATPTEDPGVVTPPDPTTQPSTTTAMQAWLSEDLFDEIPKGLPLLAPEPDDESED